ncbi:hypothetical protein SAMN05421776_12320 [Nocardia farcinica]|uniref:Uncharacterized protein n=1 Tax=Nocardia farcinica TaxID=37329 RepID=A0A0H5P926_NOCFR|nr:hypothetical protein [Nocardia farcinica]AXK88612.1 hypothetical protein DXT66_25995 [Nocardia farcinica]PFW98709.1 hypothetical protein CJ469_05962 [Nocardia farcinica]PFX04339.1 hypothetical protein CJ468_05585 [Nocardia farcinica]CRY84365.1 Uncharacterised protein [Nocardia farcinica]SIT34287.1 hypothetical protein SAMN05421776_12320 [Nocardia farcinica]
MLVYAAPEDLADGWLTDLPDNTTATQLIRYASQLVREATRLDLYDTYPSGLPVDLDIAEAMREATCAQAAMWHLAGINPAAGTVGRELAVASQTADGGSVAYGDTITGAEVERSLSTLSGMALRILRNAGLASTRPCTW